VATDTNLISSHCDYFSHAGGNKRMAELVPGITIVGGELDEVPAATLSVKDGQIIHVSIGFSHITRIYIYIYIYIF